MSKSNSVSSPYLFQSRHGIWYARIVVPEEQRSSLIDDNRQRLLAVSVGR
ncbi:hypothetical protein [Shewanella sp. GutDb-MelDb]|nr:hypothetical protein [Shewanella sp. GutDb-MelDb]